MIDRLFQKELAQLKELAAEFAVAHPALAPMLAGTSADPDVERLFEGVAFQNALLRQKLKDDFPEFIQDLALLLCPQYLRPIPATTIVAFSPKESLARSQTVRSGSQLASVPVEGVRCMFRTCGDIEVHPLELVDAVFAQPMGEGAGISLSFSLSGLILADWAPRSLRLFLSGEYPEASDLYLLLRRHLRRIVLTPESGGRPAVLPPESLLASGFAPDEAVIPYPPQAFPGFRLIQEYLSIPHRFLFLDLVGWERWVERGSGCRFTVRFEFEPLPLPPPRINRESFVLFAVPAVNLFPHKATPVRLDHRKERYLIRPEGVAPEKAQVFSVDQVIGLAAGSARKRSYHPFERFRCVTAADPAYHTTLERSPVRSDFDIYLSVAYPKGESLPEQETLSISLTCTNGDLPKMLKIGDLSQATTSSPECATFRNVMPITPTVMPPLGDNFLWRLVAHQSLTHSSLAGADNLRMLLALYLFEEGNRDRTALAANRRRIQGIDEFVCVPTDRLFKGVPMRGQEIRLKINGDHFAGAGDLFLFGCVLDHFSAGSASINSFTRLTLSDSTNGENTQWPPRLGQQTLL